jgi:hypothetical protein
VNKKGNIEVRLIRPVQKITALIVFVFFLLVAIFCVYSLAVFLLSDRCTPTCAITGATELLLISSIFIWWGKNWVSKQENLVSLRFIELIDVALQKNRDC